MQGEHFNRVRKIINKHIASTGKHQEAIFFTVFTDASYSHKRGRAGFGIVLLFEGKTIRVWGNLKGTKDPQHAEMFAVQHALRFIPKGALVRVYTDCTYVTSNMRPDAEHRGHDAGHWESLKNLASSFNYFSAEWVKRGTSKYNVEADRLARSARYIDQNRARKKGYGKKNFDPCMYVEVGPL